MLPMSTASALALLPKIESLAARLLVNDKAGRCSVLKPKKLIATLGCHMHPAGTSSLERNLVMLLLC